jgi:TolA-binding protein
MGRAPIFLSLIASALFTSSCFLWTTSGQGQALRSDVSALEARVERIDSELDQDREELTEMIDRARAELEELESTLTRATRVLARNSADFGAEMETAKDRLREVDGALAEIRHEVQQIGIRVDESGKKINEFALAAGLDLPVDESKVPAKAPAHFAAIKESFAAGRYGEVRSLAKIFLARYPKDALADDTQLLFARSYLAQKRWAKSLGALRRFTDLYPKSEHTPEVLYEMANAFYQLGDCTDARILVEAISQRHKKSPFAAKAAKLKEQMSKNKSRCTS